MGRKKKKPLKPWCWYCNREFDDDKILTQHQRAKHYKCPFCHKKLYSGPGLTVHCIQVHKEKLDKIPEALPNRNSVDIDIYGMQGIPEDDLREHERLKRGDDGRSKSEHDSKSQVNKNSSTSHQQHPYNPPSHPLASPSNPMQAMFQHAMSMGMMPPGFPMHLPPGASPMSLPPGFISPPGFPGVPPAMHPGMPPPMHPSMQPMHPSMAPPPLGFPHMMPPSTSQYLRPPMGFHGPPPPPPPPPDEPSTNDAQQLPPPMSGVGQLIGVRSPTFKSDTLPPPIKPQGGGEKEENVGQQFSGDHLETNQPRGHTPPSTNSAPNPSSTASTIAKPAIIKTESATSFVASDYIDIPASKIRIMHPNEDLSLEEMRLRLSKYKSFR